MSEITTLPMCCSISTSGHHKFLLEVFSIFHYRRACCSAHWSGRQGGRFTPPKLPAMSTYPLSIKFLLTKSISGRWSMPRDKHTSTQIQAKHFKAIPGQPHPQYSAWAPDSSEVGQKTWCYLLIPHHAGTSYNIACPPFPPSPLCSTFFLAETTPCYRSR